MYTQQTAIDPSLAALLQTAQMVTPDQTPTVAAQVAQAAQQKMQPQGIMQGMQGAKQDYAAAQPSMMRNMQQQQMQQMLRQAMQPQPAGIERLPARNMQRMPEGGVIGFAGDGEFGSMVPNPEAMATDELRVEEFNRRRQEEYQRQKAANEAYRANIARQKQEEQQRVQLEFLEQSAPAVAARVRQQMSSAPQATPPAPQMAPEAQAMTRQQGPRGQPSAPAPRPEGRPATERAPAAGIAQLVAPTPEAAMASARSVLGLGDTSALRKKEDEYLAALKAQPATGQQGLAALQAQQAELQRMYEEANQRSGRERVIRQLLGRARGSGGAAAADIEFMGSEEARRKSYHDLQVANATKRDAIIDLQNARAAGNAKAALEAEQRIREADMEIAKTEGNLAANFASSQANVYGTQMQAETAAANRAQQAMLEGARLKQQAELNGQTKLANQINAANITVASAIEKMDRDLEKRFGQSNKLFQIMSPEDIQKNPGLAASYQQYQRERDSIYKTSVEPAINHRNRLAAMVIGGQDLSKWGEPQVKTSR